MIHWLRLVRLPAVFTAIADIMMGYLFVRDSLIPVNQFLLLAVSSSALYMAGMVCNDLFDVEQDRRERPDRPLPAQNISLAAAMRLACVLIGLGLAAALVCAWQLRSPRPAAIAITLVLAIVAYDAVTKSTILGPWNMGFCRGLNVLLGMSAAGVVVDAGIFGGFDSSQLLVAAAITIYVSGITWYARQEARQGTMIGSRSNLHFGLLIMVVGLTMLATLPWWEPFASGQRPLRFRSPWLWPIAMALLSWPTIRRCYSATLAADSGSIQAAIKQAILSLIVLNATICLVVCSHAGWSLLVVSMVIPFLLLGRWIYVT